MLTNWTPERIRRMQEADACTGFGRQMAALLRDDLPIGGTLCDLGCGLGLADLALARDMAEITCIDRSETAIEALRQEAAQRGIGNLQAVCADAEEAAGTYDAVTALFFGGAEVYDRFFPLARQVFLLAVNRSCIGTFGPEARKTAKNIDLAQVLADLDARGLSCTLRECSLEFGQPFRTLSDAADFLRDNTAPMDDAEVSDYLQTHLQETGREDFPYYLPHRKEFGLIIIRRDTYASP